MSARTEREIRYIWFDQDDTLYSYQEAARRALTVCVAAIHERFPETRQSVDCDELIAIRSEVSERALETGLIGARRLSFHEALRRHAHCEDTFAEMLTEAYYRALQADIAPFPGTVACLETLASEYTLGILSNGMSLLEPLGIARFFEHRVYGEPLRLYKPARGIYDHAMVITGAGPEQHLLVGDDRICDVVGAREVGWTGVWLSHGRAWEIDADPPECTITSLADLPPLVDELNAARRAVAESEVASAN